MNSSALFIRRPVATTLLAVGIALAGMIAFQFLPVASLPLVDLSAITVSAALPGASPETMASSVATPLEKQFSHIAGIKDMNSTSTLGLTSIKLSFDKNRNVDGAARDVEAAINAARSYLPANLPSNPAYRKIDSARAPVLVLNLTSKTADPGVRYDTASSWRLIACRSDRSQSTTGKSLRPRLARHWQCDWLAKCQPSKGAALR
jgi:multidrug efflux pump